VLSAAGGLVGSIFTTTGKQGGLYLPHLDIFSVFAVHFHMATELTFSYFCIVPLAAAAAAAAAAFVVDYDF
jgi:hypothetical protein